MPVDFKVKTFRMKNSIVMVIPREIVKALEIKEGDILAVNTDDHRLVAKKE